jgi:hypothetical protein
VAGERRRTISLAAYAGIGTRLTGLIRSGRASSAEPVDAYIRLTGKTRDHYFVAHDGSEVLRGETIEEADELQPGFVDAMERAGRMAA